MSLLDNLNKLIIEATKQRNKAKKSALVGLKNELLTNNKAKKPLLELDVANAYRKKLVKALDLYAKTDKFQELKEEIQYIDDVLPKEMDPSEVISGVEAWFVDNPDHGMTMGEIIKMLKNDLNTSNAKLIAEQVKANLKRQINPEE